MISLRPVESGDEARILRWRNLPEVADYMYTDHRITEAEHARWFRAAGSDPSRRYWIIVCDGEPVGLANIYGLDGHHRRCYWAFYLASPSVRGKGVGSFVEYWVLQHVFGELGLHKLCCEVLAFNEPVVRMHESFGFRREGLLRQHIFKNGKPHDVVSLSILRGEWEQARPGVEERLTAKGIL